jgi:hypothetical protein
MDTEKTTETGAGTESTGEEGTEETITVSKKDYDVLNQTIGAQKKQIKDFQRAQEEAKRASKETSEKTESDNVLMQKLERMSLRQAGITHTDDIELARVTAKKWGVDVDEVLGDEDFRAKLARQQTSRANVEATSGVKGGTGGLNKSDPNYFISRGEYPTREEMPDRKQRMKVQRAMAETAKSGKKFYND